MKQWLKHFRENDLYAWVFVTGAVVLVIEVVAVRILAPYFGNTLFSVSSVLSVVLLALSAGYWFGGNLADKTPKRSLFYSIIGASGLLVLLLELVRSTILEVISDNFSLASGPLVSAVILFIGPAFLLGMLSPLAIKLKSVENKKIGIGRVTGGMFFWSTLGSISGSLSAGFVLIPQFGVDSIMLGVAVTLIALGGLPLVFWENRLSSRQAAVVVLLVGALVATVVLSRQALAGNVLYQADGVYERIKIWDGEYEGRPARFLTQDRSSSSAAYLNSDDLVFEYSKYYELYHGFHTTLENTLVLGGGAYSLPKAFLNEPDQPQVDVVEIEPSLLELSHKYFDLPYSDRLHNHVEDGRRFLKRSDTEYDLIFGDVYKSLLSIPSHFTTVEFFELIRDRLSDDGVFVSNLAGDTYRVNDSFTLAEMRTFRSVFPNSYFFATRTAGFPGTQNIVMVGAKNGSPNSIDYEALKGIDPTFENLKERLIDPTRFRLDDHQLITDNYAPVDYLVSRLLSRSRGAVPNVGEQAKSIIEQLLGYGARHAGSPGGDQAALFIEAEMRAHSDEVKIQQWQNNGVSYRNVIGSIAPEKERRIVLASHYDSKLTADRDEEFPQQPVPGANDSASGVATLLQVAQDLGQRRGEWGFDFGIDFVFFDGEEGPPEADGIPSGWRPVGSQYFAKQTPKLYGQRLPEAAVVLDMVCEKDAVFKREPNSQSQASNLVDSFWSAGQKVYKNGFSDELGTALSDDHSSLNAAGIPSILVIDFEYPSFHTTADTLDKCSSQTLQKIVLATLGFVQSYDD